MVLNPYIEEAESEHEEAKILLEEMKLLNPSDTEFKTKIKQLKKAVQHHVEEKESGIFSALSDCMSDTQLNDLGKEFQTAKAKLESEVVAAMAT